MSAVLALLAGSLVLGIIAQRWRVFPPQTAHVLNAFALNISLPALVLRVLHDLELTGELGAAAGMIWLQFLAALGFCGVVAKLLKLSRRTVGALVLTAGLANTAFVGLPFLEMVYGKAALGPAVFVDQLGSFLVMATLGIFAAAYFSGSRASPAQIAWKVIKFPPFIALIVAFLLRPVALPAWADLTLGRLADMLTPIALFSVGFQLKIRGLRGHLGPLTAGLLFKLVLAPALAAAVFALFAAPGSLVWKVTVLQCAMPPMVTGAILAAEYDLEPELANAMVGLGLPLSALTLAIGVAVLG